MAEYIDRLKVLKEMHCSHTLPFFIGHRTDEDVMFCQMLDIVTEQPIADVVEVKHGEWKIKPNTGGFEVCMRCSVCGFQFDNWRHIFRYCPVCGAKMDGDKK